MNEKPDWLDLPGLTRNAGMMNDTSRLHQTSNTLAAHLWLKARFRCAAPGRRNAWSRVIAIAALTVVLLGSAITPNRASADDRLVVFAAASMSRAMDEILQTYNTMHGARSVGVYAASGTLARQIENGADPALFISANVSWMQALIDNGHIDDADTSALSSNTLVLIAPSTGTASTAHLQPTVTPPDLTPRSAAYLSGHLKDGERLAMGNPDHSPVGYYARQAMKTLGLWSSIKDHIAGAQNASAAVTMVARGEAALGLVYRSDIQGLTSVTHIACVPDEAHDPIVYQIAPLKKQRSDKRVLKLLTFLMSSEAEAILTKNGFKLAP
ncbi:MAG: molybdate ABC transporter substrate-binding protein [Pseudomonadota bacterium]